MNQTTSSKTRSEIEHRIDVIKDDPVCKKLKDISLFRNEHEKLEQVITQTFSKQEAASDKARQGKKNQSLIDIQEAYEHFCKSVNILDATKEGQQAWDNAKKAYEIAITKIEAQLSQLLRNNLSKAQNASEML
jgi:dynein heavy chain 1